MPDLTLDELRDIPREKLEQLLRDETGIYKCSDTERGNPLTGPVILELLLKQLRVCSQWLLRDA